MMGGTSDSMGGVEGHMQWARWSQQVGQSLFLWREWRRLESLLATPTDSRWDGGRLSRLVLKEFESSSFLCGCLDCTLWMDSST